jgi:hypothetical protein
VFEGGKTGAVGGDVALGLAPGHIVAVAMVEWPQVFRRIRLAGRNVDDLPAKVGISLGVIPTADPGTALVLAPLIAIDVAAGPALFPCRTVGLSSNLHSQVEHANVVKNGQTGNGDNHSISRRNRNGHRVKISDRA